MLISNAYAQAATTAAASSSFGGDYVQILMMVVMFVVMYFILVRPQMKKAKDHKAMVERLAKGDEVITQGGLAGRLTKIGEDFVTIEVADKVEIQMQKQAISVVLLKGTLKSQ